MDPTSRVWVIFGALLLMGVVVATLRWTFGTGKNVLAPHVVDPDDPTGFGLLEEVSRVPTATAAEVLCDRLGRAGIRATLRRLDEGGYGLLVFPDDVVSARIVLSRGALE